MNLPSPRPDGRPLRSSRTANAALPAGTAAETPPAVSAAPAPATPGPAAAPPLDVSSSAPPTLDAPSLDALLGRADLWRGAQMAQPPGPTLPSGYAALDAELPGGGWPGGALIELLAGGSPGRAKDCKMPTEVALRGNGALTLLLPVLVCLTRAGRWVALIDPPLAVHAPALAAQGVDLAHLLHITTADGRERDWACERCLRSGAIAAVIAWPGQPSFTTRKRLQLAAEAGGGSLFLLLPEAVGRQSSPAPLRITVEARAEGIALSFLKRRGPRREAPLTLPLARPLPPRRRSKPHPEGNDDALARPLATRTAADRAPRPTAA